MIVNAAHAIGDDPARRPGAPLGRITISTRRTETEMLITIADDGPGMPPKVRDRVFDPFFTTKPVGKGTGQGLSLAHAVIVTKHGGRIDLDTAPAMARPSPSACRSNRPTLPSQIYPIQAYPIPDPADPDRMVREHR